MQLTGVNTYGGNTTVSAGILAFNSIANDNTTATALGKTSNNIDIAGGAGLKYVGTAVGGHSSNRTLNLTGTGTVSLDASGVGDLTLNGSLANASGKNILLTGTGTGNENKVLDLGTGTLTKEGAGTWQLGAANTFTGLTTVNAGTLKYGITNAISSGAVTVSGTTAVLDLQSFSDSVGAMSLINGAINGTGTLTSTSGFDVQNGSVAAVLGGGVGLTKTGAGTVILSGDNTYSGATNVNLGTLRINGGAVGGNASNVTVNGSGTLAGTGTIRGAVDVQSTGTFTPETRPAP